MTCPDHLNGVLFLSDDMYCLFTHVVAFQHLLLRSYVSFAEQKAPNILHIT
jgi:hypothetical protein